MNPASARDASACVSKTAAGGCKGDDDIATAESQLPVRCGDCIGIEYEYEPVDEPDMDIRVSGEEG
jgi:hypothetical protein